MEAGLVSVMMPAYNAETYIGMAIESVLAQTYPHWELIVVNDGSADGTGPVAESFADPRVRVYHRPNGGEAAARNFALDQMRGEFVAFLDADDLFLPEHLALTVAHLQRHPEHGGVYTDGHYCDGAGVRLEKLSSHRRGPFTGDIFAEVVRASDVFGPPICVVLRRQVVVAHDLRFDPEIVIGPDWDFLTRFAAVTHFGYVDQATCRYRVHQTNVTVRTDARRRALYLARCREKAIHLPRFAECPVDVQVAAFYDLLVEQLAGYPERQSQATAWPQFALLPRNEQARLLRLMASQALLRRGDRQAVARWLAEARRLNPADVQAALLSAFFQFNPRLCRLLLTFKQAVTRRGGPPLTPFGKLS
ncbi:MAG: hypothetical protein KatS3mg050_0897 [Litorilinea sp.]|nr:MAG: hypothetical protein KatS3mg050_0897 [Litorilinea sp.]